MSEFTDYLHEIFSEFGAIEIRRIFGGHGVYYDDIIIGLIARDALYLKADKQSVHLFEELELEPFRYPKGDKMVAMSYYQAPGEALEDPAEMKEWAQAAYDAALRSR
jgi:DNA transformation protein